MGERLDCEATFRVPIAKDEEIDVELGDTVSVEGEEWKITLLTVNRLGSNPHYHLKGVR